jgi:hypothetical protein
VQFKLGAAIARRVARASDATERRIGNRHVVVTEVERAPVENIGVDPARLRQEFPSDRDIARIDLDAGGSRRTPSAPYRLRRSRRAKFRPCNGRQRSLLINGEDAAAAS